MNEVSLVADGLSFLEGPRWHEGWLYVSDFHTGRVLRTRGTASLETVCTIDGQPSGLGFAPDGSLLIVSMLDRRLLRWADGRLDLIADFGALIPDPANDMFVDQVGRAYIGNFGTSPGGGRIREATKLIRIDPDGAVHEAASDLRFPNGIARGAGGDTLLIAETFASRISEYRQLPDGTLCDRRSWAAWGDGPRATIREMLDGEAILPDGIVLDREGALWVGDAGGRGAVRVARGGAILDRVPTGDLSAYAAALGGEDGRTLFLCAAPPLLTHDASAERRACLLSCRVEIAGVAA